MTWRLVGDEVRTAGDGTLTIARVLAWNGTLDRDLVVTSGAEDGRVRVTRVSRVGGGNGGSAFTSVEDALTRAGQLANLSVGLTVSSADDAGAFTSAGVATCLADMGEGLGSDSGSEDGEDSKLEH